MELTLLGTGTCAPNPLRAPAGYFLSHGPSRFLIDPGPGACHRAVTAGLDPYDVEAIVITHLHLDHTGDLMPYLFNYKHRPGDDPRPDIKIIAPEGFTQTYQKLLEVYGGWVISDKYAVRIEEMSDTVLESPGMTIRSLPVAHSASAIGYRFQKEDGPSLVFSGDTGYCDELVALAMGADALMVECSFPDGAGMEGHMTPEDVARTGALSGAGKLILTHFYPAVDTANVAGAIRKHGYKGGIIVGEDGMKIDIR